MRKRKIERYLAGLKNGKSDIIPALQRIQTDLNYLPEELLKEIAIYFNTPLIDVYSIATFYKAFSLKPKGKYIIKLCLGTACHVRGAQKILNEVKRILKINPGETTEDNLFTLETVNCLGACALGPIMVVNNEYHGQMTVKMVENLLESYKAKTEKI